MTKPSFTNFLMEMGPDKQREWSDSTARIIETSGIPLDETGVKAVSTIMNATTHLVMCMLSDYHAWLFDYLEQNSFRLVK